jgi:hypothetical protein
VQKRERIEEEIISEREIKELILRYQVVKKDINNMLYIHPETKKTVITGYLSFSSPLSSLFSLLSL